MLAQVALIAIPFLAMSGATGWPATTGDPGSKMLPLVLENLTSIRIGYGGYLAYSLLFFFTGCAALRAIREEPDWIGLGAVGISTLARCLGILRWLTAAPSLAYAYSNAEDSQRAQIAAIFDAINSYGGGVGEALGVSIFAAIWVYRIGTAARRNPIVPVFLTRMTFLLAAFMLIPVIELFGFDLGPVLMLTGTLFHFWLIAFGILMVRRGKSS
jgi:hypothetical protein